MTEALLWEHHRRLKMQFGEGNRMPRSARLARLRRGYLEAYAAIETACREGGA
jgi:hypothetical protein